MIWKICKKIGKRYEKYGRKISWIVKRYGKYDMDKYGTMASWRYGKYDMDKYGTMASWIVKRYEKYGSKIVKK